MPLNEAVRKSLTGERRERAVAVAEPVDFLSGLVVALETHTEAIKKGSRIFDADVASALGAWWQKYQTTALRDVRVTKNMMNNGFPNEGDSPSPQSVAGIGECLGVALEILPTSNHALTSNEKPAA